jgi:hypothetical protein
MSGIAPFLTLSPRDCDAVLFQTRVWQWFRDGQLVQRTLIDAKKVSDNWSQYPI